MDNNFPTHTELFEVVLLKDGTNEMKANTEDFRRVPIEASSPLQAQMSDKVLVEGYHSIFATKPGILTDPEVMARRRAMDGESKVDRTKL